MISTHELLEMTGDVSMSVQVRRISEALVAAVNDWQMLNLNSLEAFVYELENEIGSLSKVNIRQKLKDYSPVDDAWKMESLKLLVAWDNENDDVLLDDLIKRIRGATEFGKNTTLRFFVKFAGGQQTPRCGRPNSSKPVVQT